MVPGTAGFFPVAPEARGAKVWATFLAVLERLGVAGRGVGAALVVAAALVVTASSAPASAWDSVSAERRTDLKRRP